MRIRERAAADVAACAEVLLQVQAADGYPMRVPSGDAAGFVTSERELAAWVAEHEGRVVGHAALHWAPDDATIAAGQRATGHDADQLVLVSRLFVAPDARGLGAGRALLRHATAQAHALGRRAVLDVGTSLTAAVGLYEAAGWQRVEQRQLPLDDTTVLDLWVYLGPAPLHIAAVDPVPQDALDLLARHREWAAEHSPPEDVHALDVSSGLDPALTLFAARDERGGLLGVGGLRELDATHGELKGMHTPAAARGRGVGRAVLAHLVAVARERGYERVSLETGTMEAFAAARALYASVGFAPCPPFGAYVESRNSTCMTRRLDTRR